jgi:toluene monooxygenase system protein D
MSEHLEMVIEALRDDNPEREIEVVDQGAYVRVRAQARLRLTLPTLRRHLGPSFEMRKLEPMLAAFAGRITTTSDEITWSLGAPRAGAPPPAKEDQR